MKRKKKVSKTREGPAVSVCTCGQYAKQNEKGGDKKKKQGHEDHEQKDAATGRQ